MRPTWAEIRLDRVASNYRSVKRFVGAGIAVMAVVKADAYGHGAIEVARYLERQGVDCFGVALVEEGKALRQAGITAPIVCLGGFWQQARECVDFGITPAIYRIDMLQELEEAAQAAARKVPYHLKLDTGMGRLGVQPAQLGEFLDYARKCSWLVLEGVFTHFASADEPEKDWQTKAQIDRYRACLAQIESCGISPRYHHLSNSAGLHRWKDARGNLVRTGGLLYGLWRDIIAPQPEPPSLEPVLSLHSRIILLKTVPAGTTLGYGATFTTERQSLIATIPIGYDDGLRRACSNNGRVIVRGCYAPIVGRVSMDLTLLDVTDVLGVTLGDEVLLIGAANGLRVTAEEVAARTGTISFEVTCAISGRVPRIYRGYDVG